MLLERSSERERTLADASERRLMRLGFDLHDGALQDLAVLGHDVQNAQREIASASRRAPAAW
jgi:signal transduction histidine kinase